MNDDMSLWLPVAEHLQNISLSGILVFRTILDAEIVMSQESFYNEYTEKQGVSSKSFKRFSWHGY